MAEYMVKVNITAAGTYNVPIKNRVLGVYSTAAVKVGWDFNGEVSDITPAATSKLVITATSAAVVTIRME